MNGFWQKLAQRTIHIILLSNGKHENKKKHTNVLFCSFFFCYKKNQNVRTKAWISAVHFEVMICNLFLSMRCVYACFWLCLFCDFVDYIFSTLKKALISVNMVETEQNKKLSQKKSEWMNGYGHQKKLWKRSKAKRIWALSH